MKSDLTGYCDGRTLLPRHNFWLLDIAPMISKSDAVKHSLLSFAAGYVLDHVPQKPVQDRANHHWARAMAALGRLLGDPVSQEPGREEATVASLMLLLGDDASCRFILRLSLCRDLTDHRTIGCQLGAAQTRG